jgi:hypothetical protein
LLGGPAEQLQTLALQGRLGDGVLHDEPGGVGPVLRDQAPARPAVLGNDLAEAGGVAIVDLPHPRVVAIAEGAVFHQLGPHSSVLGSQGEQFFL